MSRINYPETWPQSDRDALDAMFETARRDGLWFYHGGLSGPLWYSPDELQAEQENGKFVWGAVNWTLRDPKEYLAEAQAQVVAAQGVMDTVLAEIDRWQTKRRAG